MLETHELTLQVTVRNPPDGVLWAMQSGKTELVSPFRVGSRRIEFRLTVRVRPIVAKRAPHFLGAFAQGPPAARFLYINSGTYAGQAGSCWSRRAKIPLSGITAGMVQRVVNNPALRLEAAIHGANTDGGPVCASVPLLGSGWQVVSSGTRRAGVRGTA